MSEPADTGLETRLDLDGVIYRLDKGYWVKFEAHRVDATKQRPHGISYSLTLHDRANTRVIGFDNAHGCPAPRRKRFAGRKITWDHRHRSERIIPYEYVGRPVDPGLLGRSRAYHRRTQAMMRRRRVGIMPREEFIKRTVAIAKGEYKPGKDEPKIWFESVQSFAQVLSDDNRLLLHIIEERKPQSLSELAELTGRQKSNLSRTLHTMAGYGIVDLVRNRTRALVPRVKANRFDLKIELPRECAFCK